MKYPKETLSSVIFTKKYWKSIFVSLKTSCSLLRQNFYPILSLIAIALLASVNFDTCLDNLIPGISLNSFYAVLVAGIGLSFVLEDLKKVWNTKPNQEEPEKNENPNAKVTNPKDK